MSIAPEELLLTPGNTKSSNRSIQYQDFTAITPVQPKLDEQVFKKLCEQYQQDILEYRANFIERYKKHNSNRVPDVTFYDEALKSIGYAKNLYSSKYFLANDGSTDRRLLKNVIEITHKITKSPEDPAVREQHTAVKAQVETFIIKNEAAKNADARCLVASMIIIGGAVLTVALAATGIGLLAGAATLVAGCGLFKVALRSRLAAKEVDNLAKSMNQLSEHVNSVANAVNTMDSYRVEFGSTPTSDLHFNSNGQLGECDAPEQPRRRNTI
jgi:hypothetical protein